MEVLINGDYGGFSFTSRTIKLFKERTGRPAEEYLDITEFRADPAMIQVYKDLGAAENPVLRLEIIRSGYEQCWRIHEYDGAESIEYDEAAFQLLQLKAALRAILSDNKPDSERLAAVAALLA
jgi:hypothetical protein